jgi:hypothetical protein
MSLLNEKSIHKALDELYLENNRIIKWLDEIKKPENQKDGKIPNLFLKSITKIKIDGDTYNLILIWIMKNIDKFEGYDFTGIPESQNVSLIDLKNVKSFTKIEDIERWISNPEINPYDGTPLLPSSDIYYNIYVKAFNILKKNNISDNNIRFKLPLNHVLFGDIDLNYYKYLKEKVPDLDVKSYPILFKYNNKNLIICDFLIEDINGIYYRQTIFETEIELLRNRFTNNSRSKNLDNIKTLFNDYNQSLIESLIYKDYIGEYGFNKIMEKIEDGNVNINIFKYFLKYNMLSNGETIIDFFIKLKRESNTPQWIIDALEIYDNHMLIYKDVADIYNPESGLIENIEDKKYLPIKDPLEDYFEIYENKLREIKKPIYSQLIDLTTFKPKENLKYLNNAEYKKFKKEKDKYESHRKKYHDNLTLYEETKTGSSPKPPEKPKITLPWGKEHTIGKEIDPIHIKDFVVKKFKKKYEKAIPSIQEYNKIKNMSYLELKKYFGNSSSSSSASKRIIKDNELLHMTKQQIVDNVLYDYSGLADKCSESIDILTNEELDDENYPLAKLQLMVRLKVNIRGTKKYRTECIYAPKLYNYLVKCINDKEYFVNPVTKSRYTEEHIEELMKVMRIIDPNIERPVFIKHRNDTMLEIKYELEEIDNDEDADYNDISFRGIHKLNFYNIYISRNIGGVEHIIYELCTIPADIEPTGTFATGSTDLTSNTMLFRICKLFNEGKLLHNYLPPYCIEIEDEEEGYYQYIKPKIHFNNYNRLYQWFWKNDEPITKDEFIAMFKHYAEEINNYIY